MSQLRHALQPEDRDNPILIRQQFSLQIGMNGEPIQETGDAKESKLQAGSLGHCFIGTFKWTRLIDLFCHWSTKVTS